MSRLRDNANRILGEVKLQMISPVLTPLPIEDRGYHARAREIFIRLSLLALMAVSCAILLRPFLNFIICGIIIAVALYPVYVMLTRALHGRATLAAVLCSGVLLLALIVPSVLLGGTLVGGIRTISQDMQAGRLDLPPAPPSIGKIPIIGRRLEDAWTLCSTNLSEAVTRFGPQIKQRVPALLSATAGVGGAVVQFLIAIILAGFLLATSEANGRFADRLFLRIFGGPGPEIKELVASTIRTVTNGILGVAVAGWRACADSGSTNGVCNILYDPCGDFPGVVHHRRADGQRPQAHTPGPGRQGSNGRNFSGRAWRVHGDEQHHRPFRRRHCLVGGIQAVHGVAGQRRAR